MDKNTKRLMMWIIGLLSLILIDEYIKEGYLINYYDFIKPLTHENILLILATILIMLIVNEAKKTMKKD
jgi:hypothetical protein